jgi:hypothetical protein
MPDHDECPCQVPETLELGCAWEIAKILKNGDILKKKGHVMKELGCLLLSLGGQLDDESVIIGSDGFGFNQSDCPHIEEAEAYLEIACGNHGKRVAGHKQVNGVVQANPFVMKVLKSIIVAAVTAIFD